MHFEQKSNDFNEENYISCTLDEENANAENQAATGTANANATARPPSSSTSNQVASPENVQSVSAAAAIQTHNCNKCNYTTTFKNNLVS